MKKSNELLTELKDLIVKLWLYKIIYYDSNFMLNNIKTSLQDLRESVCMLNDLNIFEEKMIKDILIDLLSIRESDINQSKQIIDNAIKKLLPIEQYLKDELKLRILKKEIDTLVIEIKNSKDLLGAERYFIFLERIQEIIAKYTFKQGLNISDDLYKFVQVFDRIDDEDFKKIIFNKIKHDKYYL